MPGRDIPIVNGEIYHIFNRGNAKQPIFDNKWNYRRFMEIISYYQNQDIPSRFSKFMSLGLADREHILKSLDSQNKKMVEIYIFCLMPNHFHLLLKQLTENGIRKYISNITNSYTRYYNVRNGRVGHLFQGKYKAVRIEDDKQLLHVSRYIHLNPYSSFIVKNINQLINYPYSSLREYLGINKIRWVEKYIILSHFKSQKSFYNFTIDRADYQKDLESIKHLTFEK